MARVNRIVLLLVLFGIIGDAAFAQKVSLDFGLKTGVPLTKPVGLPMFSVTTTGSMERSRYIVGRLDPDFHRLRIHPRSTPRSAAIRQLPVSRRRSPTVRRSRPDPLRRSVGKDGCPPNSSMTRGTEKPTLFFTTDHFDPKDPRPSFWMAAST